MDEIWFDTHLRYHAVSYNLHASVVFDYNDLGWSAGMHVLPGKLFAKALIVVGAVAATPLPAGAGDAGKVIELFGRIIEQGVRLDQRQRERERRQIEFERKTQEFQVLLKDMGLYDKAIDGKFGPATEAAAEEFARRYRLRGGLTIDQAIAVAREKKTLGWNSYEEEKAGHQAGYNNGFAYRAARAARADDKGRPKPALPEKAVPMQRETVEIDEPSPNFATEGAAESPVRRKETAVPVDTGQRYRKLLDDYISLYGEGTDPETVRKRCSIGAELIAEYQTQLDGSTRQIVEEQNKMDACKG
jgi:hypothetical protein